MSESKIFFTEEEQVKIDKIKEYIETNKEDIKTKYSERTYVSFYYDEENDEVKVCDGIYNSSSGLEVKYNLKETVFDDISVFESYKPIKIGYYYSEELSSRIIIDKDGGEIQEYYHEGQLTSRTTKDKKDIILQENYTDKHIEKIDSANKNKVINTIYLKSSLEDNSINEQNKIFTLEENKTDNSKTIRFYKNDEVGIDKDIEYSIDKDGFVDKNIPREDIEKLKAIEPNKKFLLLQLLSSIEYMKYFSDIINNNLPIKENILSNSRINFLEKIEEKEITGEKTKEKITDYIVNNNSGGEFVIYDKNSKNSKTEQVGKLGLYGDKFYIVNEKTKYIKLFEFNDIKEINEKYDIKYIDKEKSDKPQDVFIEDANNITTDKGVVLAFNKNNSNNNIVLTGIYNGEFTKNSEEKKVLAKGECEVRDYIITPEIKTLNKYTIDKDKEYNCIINLFTNDINSMAKFDKTTDLKHNISKNAITIIDSVSNNKTQKLISGTAYLQSENVINPDNKIYTVTTDNNSNIIKYTFYTTNPNIGLDRDIQVSIDDNGIVKLETTDGKDIELTEEEISKIKNLKQFFKIPIDKLSFVEHNINILYHAVTLNKNKDVSIIIPKIIENVFHVENEEIDTTQSLISRIPQEKRKGKYIVTPCNYLINDCKVDLEVDFDNNKIKIINPSNLEKQDVVSSLQSKFNEVSNIIFSKKEMKKDVTMAIKPITKNIKGDEEEEESKESKKLKNSRTSTVKSITTTQKSNTIFDKKEITRTKHKEKRIQNSEQQIKNIQTMTSIESKDTISDTLEEISKKYKKLSKKIFNKIEKSRYWKKKIDIYGEDDEKKLICISEASGRRINKYSNKDEKKCNEYTKFKKEVDEALKLLSKIKDNNISIQNTEDSKKDKSRDENGELKQQEERFSNITNEFNKELPPMLSLNSGGQGH